MVPGGRTLQGRAGRYPSRPVLVRRTTPYAAARLPVPAIFQLLEAHLASAASPVITDTVPQVISLIVTNRDAPTSPGNFSRDIPVSTLMSAASGRAVPTRSLVLLTSKNRVVVTSRA